MTFDLRDLVANITAHIDLLRGQIDSGSFQPKYNNEKGIKRTCKGYNFHTVRCKT